MARRRGGGSRMARPVQFLPYHLQHKRRGTTNVGKARDAQGLIVRGVVMKTYLPDDPVDAARAAARPYLPTAPTGILCDVLITDPEFKTYLKDVPIMVQSGGLNDHEIWHPRASTLDITGAPLAQSLEGLPTLTSASHNMDGDQVLVAFLGNDTNQPVIIGQFAHPKTNRKPSFLDTAAALPQFKWRRYIRGLDIGVTQAGNIRIDMQNASAGLIDPIGTEIPTPGPDPTQLDTLGGNILITMFTGDLITGTKITIADSVLTAPEPVILGDSWLTDTSGYLTDHTSHLTKLSLALTEIQTALTGLGLPTVNIASAIAEIAVFSANIAAFQALIATAQGIGLPYLSSHLEVD